MDRSFARKKKVQRTANLLTDLPKETWRPEKKIIDKKSSTQEQNNKKPADRKRKRQVKEDSVVEDFLEERKQFFHSFCTTNLATTPVKK